MNENTTVLLGFVALFITIIFMTIVLSDGKQYKKCANYSNVNRCNLIFDYDPNPQ